MSTPYCETCYCEMEEEQECKDCTEPLCLACEVVCRICGGPTCPSCASRTYWPDLGSFVTACDSCTSKCLKEIRTFYDLHESW